MKQRLPSKLCYDLCACMFAGCVCGGGELSTSTCIRMSRDWKELYQQLWVLSPGCWKLTLNHWAISKSPQTYFDFLTYLPISIEFWQPWKKALKKKLCCTSFAITAVSSLLTPCPLRFVWFWSPFSSLAYSKTTINWTRITILSKSTATVITPI